MNENLADLSLPSEQKRVLIADDDESLLTLYANVLGRFYDVRTAQNGKIALDLLSNEGFDLLLTDVNMPEMDGIQLVKQARECGHTLVCIVGSSWPDGAPQPEAAMAAGANETYHKPIKPSDLQFLVGKYFGNDHLTPPAMPAPR